MSETKKVKAVKAVTLPTTKVEQSTKKVAKEKPAKLKFEPVISSYKISAAEIRILYGDVVEQIKDILHDKLTMDSVVAKPSDADLAFLDNNPALLAAVCKYLETGLNPLHYIESYSIAADVRIDKLFGKEIRALTQKLTKEYEVKLKEEAEAEALEQAALLKSAELNKTYGSPIRVKKAHAERVAQLLKDAGIEFIDT